MARPFASSFPSASAYTGLLCVLLCAASPARSGTSLPCEYAAAFPETAINAFALPYRYDSARPTESLGKSSNQISALAHLEILFTMLKYGAVGAIDLIAQPGKPCDVDIVVARVTRVSSAASLRRGQTAVFVWGRLFEEGNELYVQSYVRFFRQGDKGPVLESISVRVGDPEVELSAQLPAQGIAFPPRRIAKGDLESIQAEYARSMVVRDQPRLDSPGHPLEFSPDRGFPYAVAKTQGDWMFIRPMLAGPAGWVRARTDNQGPERFSLRRWLPELDYVDALNGYMRLRAAEAGPFGARSEQVEKWRNWIDEGFARFEEAVPGEEAAQARGLARAVRGFVLWNAPQGDRTAAAGLFAEARGLMPDYAAARNLAAVTRPYLGRSLALDPPAASLMGRQLLGALALDPRDDVVLGNLERYYGLLAGKPALSPYPANDVSRRLKVVRSIRASPAPLQ